MIFMDMLLHLFTPRPSNNHRARVLHTSSLSLIIVFLVLFQLGVSFVGRISPQVLGYASNINASDLLNDTNAKRAAAGAPALTLDSQLTVAAQAKGQDMFAHQYWAHVSPQGIDPWHWIIASGYNYIFAGENLARDFADSQAVVDAWMNSPTHRENLLNTRFQNVGFAVVNGKYGNDETTLVVQEFGTRASGAPTVAAPEKPAPINPTPPEQPKATESAASPATPTAIPAVPSVPTQGMILNTNNTNPEPKHQPLIDGFNLTKNVSSVILLMLIAVLIVDSLLVYRKKIVRLSGHNLAHLIFLIAVLVTLNLLGRGVVL